MCVCVCLCLCYRYGSLSHVIFPSYSPEFTVDQVSASRLILSYSITTPLVVAAIIKQQLDRGSGCHSGHGSAHFSGPEKIGIQKISL